MIVCTPPPKKKTQHQPRNAVEIVSKQLRPRFIGNSFIARLLQLITLSTSEQRTQNMINNYKKNLE